MTIEALFQNSNQWWMALRGPLVIAAGDVAVASSRRFPGVFPSVD